MLSKKQFFSHLGRFGSGAFKNYKGGISVIQKQCVQNLSTPLCSHLAEYDLSVDKLPHIFWEFDLSILPKKVEVEQEDSLSGDKCHYNLVGFTDKEAKKILNKEFSTFRDARICIENIPRKLIPSDLRVSGHSFSRLPEDRAFFFSGRTRVEIPESYDKLSFKCNRD